jgi:hypothetical protein
MNKILIDIPYLYRVLGVRKRHRKESHHEVEGRSSHHVCGITSDMLEGRIVVHREGSELVLPVWQGKVLRPLEAWVEDGRIDPRDRNRRVSRSRLSPDDMPNFMNGWLARTVGWEVAPTDLRRQRHVSHGKLGPPLAGRIADLFGSVTWSDEVDARALADVDVADLVVLDGILHTGRFEPVLQRGLRGTMAWLPVRPREGDFFMENSASPVRLDKAARAIAQGVDGFGDVRIEGAVESVDWKVRDLDMAAASALRDIARDFLRSPASGDNEEVYSLTLDKYPASLDVIAGMGRCLSAAADVFRGSVDPASAIEDALSVCRTAGMEAIGHTGSGLRPVVNHMRAVLDRIEAIEGLATVPSIDDEAFAGGI